MENPQNQLASKLKDANNVLVTVSTNPTVDQLSAAIGLTLFLTKLKKHATTVFSGQIPSTIDFLKPEETIETNTDSLRDFIISLDKNKADKIRYKVEDTMVKIFITPYRTSITDEDLVFSQGDFNVDVVVALGIQKREDIDQAIMTHGRILHDATVATVNISENTDLGTLNWTDPQASSLCEMMVALTDLLKTNSLDGQMATALLTGIVAETDRFSNEKTSSTTMNASAKLMAAGANQQLVATKLKPPEDEPPATPDQPDNPEDSDDGDSPKDATMEDDGSLRINHHSSIPEVDENQLPPLDTLPQPWTPDGQQLASEQSARLADAPGQSAEESNELQIDKDTRPVVETPPTSIPQDDILFGVPSEDQGKREGDVVPPKHVMEPPQLGSQLSVAANEATNDTSPFNLPPVPMPMPGRSPKPQQQQAPQKPTEEGPPEPYTVFEPQPDNPVPGEQDDLSNAAVSRPAEPAGIGGTSSSQAASAPGSAKSHTMTSSESESPTKITESPQRTGHSFVDMGDKTLADIEEKVESPQSKEDEKLKEAAKPSDDVDYKQEAVKHVAKVMSDKTLDQIEEKVGSVHKHQTSDKEEIDYKQEAVKHVAKVMSTKTIDQLEERVGHEHPSEEKPDAKVITSEQSKKEELSALKYEAHESEPDEKSVPAETAADNEARSNDTSKPKEELAADKLPRTEQKHPIADNTKEDSKSVSSLQEQNPEPDSTTSKVKQDEARDAVLRAINVGGDGRSSLPPIDGMGTTGMMEVSHSDTSKTDDKAPISPPSVPPPMPTVPRHSGPSPKINIDPEGTLIPLPPKDEGQTASAETPPPVPPPMMPQTSEAKT